MAIDWKKELDHSKRIYFWWMKLGLIAIPFGIIYAFVILHLGHESKTALIITVLAAIATVYKIQGMPPSE